MATKSSDNLVRKEFEGILAKNTRKTFDVANLHYIPVEIDVYEKVFANSFRSSGLKSTLQKELQTANSLHVRYGGLNFNNLNDKEAEQQAYAVLKSLVSSIVQYKDSLERDITASNDTLKTALTKFVTNIRGFINTRHGSSITITQLSQISKWDEDTTKKIKSVTVGASTIPLPAKVLRGNDIVGVLYGFYDSAYTGLFGSFLNKEVDSILSKNFLLESPYYRRVVDKKISIVDRLKKGEKVSEKEIQDADKQFAQGFDVGHLLSGTNPNIVSPLLGKIDDLLEGVRKRISDTALTSAQKSTLKAVEKEILEKRDYLLKRSTYGEAIVRLDKDFSKNLQEVKAIVVIPQDALENRYEYGTLIESKVASDILGILQRVNFSNNLLEEIPYRINNALSGKTTPNTKSSKELKVGLPKPTNKLKIQKVPTPKINSKNVKAKQKKVAVRPTSINYAGPIGMSLASLTTLLNASLYDRIKANMGGGNRTDVLNYRTGRFAKSAKVERLTQSRSGMITAFYTYMKNPYATFSVGGQQESPKSRDPKLLISKSIREIAQEQAYNRMRAVLS